MTTVIDPYLTINDIVKALRISRATIYRWIEAGRFPAGRQLGAKCTRWRASEIKAWQDQN